MILAEHSLATNALATSIWDCWTRVAEWPVWDPSLVWVNFSAPFEAGARGVMKHKGELRRPFQLVEVVEGSRFALHERWLFASLVRTYQMEPDPVGTRLACQARLSGPFAWFYWLFLRNRWSTQLPDIVRGLARLAARS